MYLKRNIEQELIDTSKSFACITIYGSRQVGKSTLVRKTFPNFNYITLDDNDELNIAINNPKLFIESLNTPIIIDEIQRAPKLLPLIKKAIDEYKFDNLNNNRANSLIYILTGSNQFNLRRTVSESLAGRTAIFNLYSLSNSEIKKYDNVSLFNPDIEVLKTKNATKYYRTRKEIFEDIFKGGMPEYTTSSIERTKFFKSYINTYIDKDIKDFISPSNIVVFDNFLKYIALRTSAQINYTDISNAIGVSTKTVKEWLSLLEASGLIIFLEPYMSNMSNRIIKAPKLYFMDTGLCAYLCGWPNPDMLENGVMNGAFYKTYVVSELVKNYQNNGVDALNTLYYYRDRDQKEVDLIIDSPEGIYPIEIKKGINPVSASKNFSFLEKYNKHVFTGLILDSCDRVRPINENLYYCPIALIGL